MKKEKFLRYLTTIGFLVFIGAAFLLSVVPFAKGADEMIKTVKYGGEVRTGIIETIYNEQFFPRKLLVTLNGGVQRLLGARNVNERYLLDNGQLTYTIAEYDMTGIGANTVALRDDLAVQGIPMVYVNTPFKIDGKDKQLPIGVEDYSNENADRFLEILEDAQVPVLDLREAVHEQGLEHGDLFLRTDHHWKAETGFWAFTEIVEFLAEQDPSYAVDPVITASESYTHTVYEKSLLGSGGRRVGPFYSWWEDFTVIEPKFETDFTFFAPTYETVREGEYSDTLLFYNLLKGKFFQTLTYSIYCGQDWDILYLTNHSAEKQLEVTSEPKRILLIKDSFSAVVVPFLAMSYDEICLLDLRLWAGNVAEFAKEYQPDLVMVMYNPGAYENNNLDMFDFLT